VASRRERKDRRATAASAETARERRRTRSRALLVGAIVAAVVGFGAGWLVRRWTDRAPEERAHEKVGEVRERVREITH
jgi:hypothetical protein